LSGGAAVMLTASSPAAWGAADGFGLASWVPAVAALILALPALAAASYGGVRVWSRMTGLFDVDMLGAVMGAGTHWIAAVCLVIFMGTMGREESYESLVREGVTTSGLVFLAVVAALIGGVLMAGLTMVYVWSVSPGRRTRIGERLKGEPDFLDDWARRPREVRRRDNGEPPVQ